MLPWWEAYHSLAGSRPVGMGVGAIPFSELLAYCKYHGVDDPEEREDLLFFIGQLDEEYLIWTSEKE